MDKAFQHASPQELSDAVQSFRDPHNEDGRRLTPERVRVQELAESGFADTLFTVAGRPSIVRSLSEGLSGGVPPMQEDAGLLGFFNASEDEALVRGGGFRIDEGIESLQQDILAHELGHRLVNVAQDEDFRAEFNVDGIDIEGLQQIVTEDSDTEEFAQNFQVALSAIRHAPQIMERFADADLEEIRQSAIEMAPGKQRLAPKADDEQVSQIMDFILSQPIFAHHPLNTRQQVQTVRQQMQPVRQDVTRVQGSD